MIHCIQEQACKARPHWLAATAAERAEIALQGSDGRPPQPENIASSQLAAIHPGSAALCRKRLVTPNHAVYAATIVIAQQITAMSILAIESLADQIARYLEEQIVSGTRPAGARIMEGQIAGQLHVSRGSVREAMLLLQRRHLISLTPRRGPEVSTLDSASANAQIELWRLLLLRSLGSAAAPVTATLDSAQPLAQQLLALASQPSNPYLQQWLEDMLPSLRRLLQQLQRHLPEPLSQHLPPLHGCHSSDAQQRLSCIQQFCQRLQQLSNQVLAEHCAQSAA